MIEKIKHAQDDIIALVLMGDWGRYDILRAEDDKRFEEIMERWGIDIKLDFGEVVIPDSPPGKIAQLLFLCANDKQRERKRK